MASRRERDLEKNKIDYGIVLSVLLLAIIGLASVYMAVLLDTTAQAATKATIMQGIWYILGIIAVAVIMQFDSEQLWRVAPVAYWFGVFLLILVLFVYNREMYINTGAKSWFIIGPISFQPSEVMKAAYILMMARLVTRHNIEYSSHTLSSDFRLIGELILWTLPVIVLLKLQNDFGTMLVFIAILGGVILMSGISWKILIPAIVGVATIAGTALFMVTTVKGQAFLSKLGFATYQFKRINSWIDPAHDTSNASYQVWQSMKAIGSGQLFGQGLGNSNVYVPVRESDMIFSVIGEQLGFIGGVALIFIYFILIYQMIRICFDTKNEFYAYIATGVIMMILFHVFENIGMGIGLLPLTGIPLPFISQGGTALIGNMIGIGLVMSMRYHYKSYMFSNDEDEF